MNPLAWETWKLTVNSVEFDHEYARPLVAGNEREWLVGPVDHGGLDVSRRVYVPDDHGFFRFMDTIKNTGATERVVDVGLEVAYATALTTLVLDPAQYAKSLALIRPNDAWVENSAQPASLGVVWGSNGSVLKPGALIIPRNNGQNLMDWTWQSVRLMPGETVNFLSYGLPGGGHAADLSGDTLSIYGGMYPFMFDGIGVEQKSLIRNFMVK